jgi:hypothetical protein
VPKFAQREVLKEVKEKNSLRNEKVKVNDEKMGVFYSCRVYYLSKTILALCFI